MADLVLAAESGNRLATLRALRDRLATEIEVCESGRDLAALSRQLTLVLADIDSLAPVKEVSFLDDLERRRKDRESAASRS